MTVFIVDDDKDDIALIEEALKQTDYTGGYETYFNGNEVLDRLTEAKDMPSLIILDLNMPLKDGYQTLKEIKSDNRFKDIPVSILTTSETEEDRKKCEAYRRTRYYSKPWAICAYVNMLRDMLLNI